MAKKRASATTKSLLPEDDHALPVAAESVIPTHTTAPNNTTLILSPEKPQQKTLVRTITDTAVENLRVQCEKIKPAGMEFSPDGTKVIIVDSKAMMADKEGIKLMKLMRLTAKKARTTCQSEHKEWKEPALRECQMIDDSRNKLVGAIEKFENRLELLESAYETELDRIAKEEQDALFATRVTLMREAGADETHIQLIGEKLLRVMDEDGFIKIIDNIKAAEAKRIQDEKDRLAEIDRMRQEQLKRDEEERVRREEQKKAEDALEKQRQELAEQQRQLAEQNRLAQEELDRKKRELEEQQRIAADNLAEQQRQADEQRKKAEQDAADKLRGELDEMNAKLARLNELEERERQRQAQSSLSVARPVAASPSTEQPTVASNVEQADTVGNTQTIDSADTNFPVQESTDDIPNQNDTTIVEDWKDAVISEIDHVEQSEEMFDDPGDDNDSFITGEDLQQANEFASIPVAPTKPVQAALFQAVIAKWHLDAAEECLKFAMLNHSATNLDLAKIIAKHDPRTD